MENETIMETSLNGLGIPSVAMLQKNAMPAVLGAVGAGVGLFAVGKLMSYDLPVVGVLDTRLAGWHPALPGVARLGVAVVAVPALAFAVGKYAKVRVPGEALAGATAVLALVGIAMAVNAVSPNILEIPGFAGAQLLTETVGGPFAGAALTVEEAGKFGGLGDSTGPGFASVLGASGSY